MRCTILDAMHRSCYTFRSKDNQHPLMHIRRDYGGLTMPLEQAQRELIQEEEAKEEEHMSIT